ncbi:MAG: hypothetical protein M1813_005421 [Trichoglossum hirsutum]|jgi:hypothetical protein|nr:MAG: hypothetical protein M1813_005421 [Trichoglossum hirsutum]
MTPQIPLRYPSLAAIEESRLKNRASRQELKQKISDPSLVEGSERYLKLCIEQIEIEQGGLELERDRMDWEMSEKKLDEKVYRTAQRLNNSRIVSLRDDLWQFRRQLRMHDGKAGMFELLTPDSEGAFAAALLRLYKKGESRDTTMQSNMRRDAITAYRALDSDAEGKSTTTESRSEYGVCSRTSIFNQLKSKQLILYQYT